MKLIEVAAGLVFRQGRLLIAQRHTDAHLGGLWEFPGGKREPKETFGDCLRRELMEELGIEVELGEEIESLTHEYPGKAVHLRFFHCRWRCHEPHPLGCRDFRWVTAAQLADYDFPAADARLLDRLRAEEHWWR